ncbi:multidrug and toxin extrusion protein 1 [Stylonychia lemnae]|uniref:Multidrug and toxin extrusion protein 1 n=1 Tax=Stylonychia lemnae TaxID=5949 RepID=A0A077ZX42_STYLE|nr:multidrug and toxin extrusion protein 1 [Stylonychia lemnae]|eukprot:CDW73086.1 multidrug and toxin extrusion protein 1 [Stylonychia lemnae]
MISSNLIIEQSKNTKENSREKTLSKIKLTKSVFSQSVPVIIQSIILCSQYIVDLYYSGYDPDPSVIAGVGFSSTFTNIIFFAVCFGFNGLLLSLVSQSIGAGNLRQAGIYVNRARVIIAAWLPIAIFLSFFVESMIKGIGIDSKTAKNAQLFTTGSIPYWIAFMYFDIARQYLYAFNKSFICTCILCIQAVCHIILCQIAIVNLGLPFYYISYLASLEQCTSVIIIHIYLKCSPQYKEFWFFGVKETFQNLGDYTKLAIPGAIMYALEYAGYEVLCMISGYISVTANAAQFIILSTNVMFYMIPQGIGLANTAIVGKSIGKMQSNVAKAQSNYIIKLSYVFALLMASIQFSLRYQIARIFTSNPEVIEIIVYSTQVSCISLALDFIYCVQQGSIRALTKFNHAIIGGFVAFYGFASPLGYIFAIYLELGVLGLWLGLTIGQMIVISYYQYLLNWGFDWEKITKECFERQEQDQNDDKGNENLLEASKIQLSTRKCSDSIEMHQDLSLGSKIFDNQQ